MLVREPRFGGAGGSNEVRMSEDFDVWDDDFFGRENFSAAEEAGDVHWVVEKGRDDDELLAVGVV